MPVAKRALPGPFSGWMSTKSAAEYLGVTEGHLRNLRSRGAGPRYHKADAIVRYRREDLDDWLTSA